MQRTDDAIDETIVLVVRTASQRIPFVQKLSDASLFSANVCLAMFGLFPSHDDVRPAA